MGRLLGCVQRLPCKGRWVGTGRPRGVLAPQPQFSTAPAVRTKRRRTSGRERSSRNEFPRGCVAASYGMQAGRSSGTPPLVRIRARHQCEGAGNRYVKAKALAALLAEIPKDKGSFGTPFFHIFRRDTKDMAPGGRSPLRSDSFHREQSPGLHIKIQPTTTPPGYRPFSRLVETIKLVRSLIPHWAGTSASVLPSFSPASPETPR